MNNANKLFMFFILAGCLLEEVQLFLRRPHLQPRCPGSSSICRQDIQSVLIRPPGKNPTTPRSGDGSLGRRSLMSGEILNEGGIVNEPNEQQLKTLLGSFLDGEDGKITMTDAVQITSTVVHNKYKNFLQIIKT